MLKHVLFSAPEGLLSKFNDLELCNTMLMFLKPSLYLISQSATKQTVTRAAIQTSSWHSFIFNRSNP